MPSDKREDKIEIAMEKSAPIAELAAVAEAKEILAKGKFLGVDESERLIAELLDDNNPTLPPCNYI